MKLRVRARTTARTLIYCFLLKQYKGVTIENRRATKRTATRSALLYGAINSFKVDFPYSLPCTHINKFANHLVFLHLISDAAQDLLHMSSIIVDKLTYLAPLFIFLHQQNHDHKENIDKTFD